MSKRICFLFLAALPLLFMVGCDVSTQVDYDKDADFSAIQSYAWVGREHPEISDLDHRRILSTVDANLAKKGLKKVESDPDVYLTYFADDEQQTVVNTTHHGYGYGAGWYRGGGMGMSSSTSHVSNYTKGTLVIDIYKAKEKELIWRGAVTGTVSEDPKKNVQKYTKGLAKLFEKYPPSA